MWGNAVTHQSILKKKVRPVQATHPKGALVFYFLLL